MTAISRMLGISADARPARLDNAMTACNMPLFRTGS